MKRIFLGTILLCASSALAQGIRYDGAAFSDKGRPTAAATIRVCQDGATGTPCSPLASIYSNQALTTAITQPGFVTDALGNYFFYAASGEYVIQISGSGITTRTMNDVPLGGAGGGGGSHNMLSATHSDSTAAAGVLGDVISFNGTWKRFAGNTSATRKLLCQTGTGTISADPVWCQPSSSDLSNDSAIVKNNAANTFTTGAQSFSAATSLIIPNSAGAAPTTSGNFGYDTTANAFKGGVNGSTKTFEHRESKDVANGYAALNASNEVNMARLPSAARLIEITFHSGASSAFTTQPAALTELFAATTLRVPLDLTSYTQFRIVAGVSVGGATNAELRVQYSLDSGSTWAYLETGGGTAHGINISATGVKTGAWSTKDASATGDILIRVVGINGDATASPALRHVKVQLR